MQRLLFNPHMKLGLGLLSLTLLLASCAMAQETGNTPQPAEQKRSWMGRILHPFSSSRTTQYKDLKIRGLELDLQISPQPVKLSETRQIEVKVTLTNKGKKVVALDFDTDQRIEIYLMNSADVVLTKWSDNHAITNKAETVLINPDEHVEYTQTIATRELTPNKVFTAEIFFPKYPELRVRQKFMTEQ